MLIAIKTKCQEEIFFIYFQRKGEKYDYNFYFYFEFYKAKITILKKLASNRLVNFKNKTPLYDYIRIISLFFKNSKFLSEAAKMRHARLKQSLSSISIGK